LRSFQPEVGARWIPDASATCNEFTAAACSGAGVGLLMLLARLRRAGI
jgi:hypothetical protein